MIRPRPLRTRRASRTRRLASLIALIILAVAGSAAAQETVRVTLPAGVSFNVPDIANTVTGSPNPTGIRFNQATLLPNRGLRISVKADTPTFTPPNGTIKIPAANVSWTTSNPNKGVGANGTLSSTSYTMVFQGQANSNTGQIDVAWKLAPLPAGVHAGTHTLTMRWKVESIVP
jgi:hypothetical protein